MTPTSLSANIIRWMRKADASESHPAPPSPIRAYPIARLSFLTRRIPAPPVSPLCTVGVGCKIPSSLPSPGQGSSWAPPPPPPLSHPLRSQAESDHTVFLLGSAFLPAANRKEAKIWALPPLPSAGTTLLLLAAWAPRSPWDQHGPLLAPTRLQGRAPIAYPSHSPLSSAPMMLARSS